MRDIQKKSPQKKIINLNHEIKDKIFSTKKTLDISKPQLKPYSLDLTELQKKSSDIVSTKKIENTYSFKECKHPGLYKSIKFFLICLIFLIPLESINVFYKALEIKNSLVENAFAAIENVKNIPENFNGTNFSDIYENFQSANKQLLKADKNIWFLKPGMYLNDTNKDIFKTVNDFVLSGKMLTEAGIYFGNSLPQIYDISLEVIKSFNQEEKGIEKSLTSELEESFKNIQNGFDKVKSSNELISKANFKVLPKEYQNKFIKAKDHLQTLTTLSNEIQQYFPAFLNMLGDRYPRRYLVLFANNNEQRAIMGFLGSGMILEFNDGYITQNQVFDIYEIDGQIVENTPLPKVFETITGNWGVRDSNYSPSGQISAKNAASLYEKAGREGVDGVIFIDLEVFKRVLEIIGEVEISSLPQKINHQNFDQVLSYIIESKIEGQNDPKKVLKNLTPIIFKKLAEEKKWFALTSIFPELVKGKHIIAYSKIEEIENLFSYLGIDGKVINPQEKQDYLSVINTSISGNKSDYYMREKIDTKTHISSEGIITNELTIERSHNFNAEAEKNLISIAENFNLPPLTPELKKILGAGDNKVSVRVYVPIDRKLKKIEGKNKEEIEIKYDEELNLTYFQTEIITKAGEKQKVKFVYETPFKLNFNNNPHIDDYIFTVQNQPGSRNTIFIKSISLDPKLKVFEKMSTKTLQYEDKQIKISSILDSDINLGLVVGK